LRGFRAMVLAEILHLVGVEVLEEQSARQMLQAGTAVVHELGGGLKHDAATHTAYAPAEIDVLEPCRQEALVEAVERLQRSTLDHQTRSGGLIHVLRRRTVEIAHPIPARPRVAGPDLVQQQHLRRHAPDVGKAAHVETPLWNAVGPYELSAGGPDGAVLDEQRLEFLHGSR